jgi:hypothetical protein
MNWNLKIKTILTLAFLIFYNLPLNATIHYVSHSGSNIPPYLTWGTAADSIQSAINVCMPGDTVLVANGVYPENLVINNIPIYLLGSSMDSTVIDGTMLSDSTIFFDNSNSTIENFNIYGSGLGVPSRTIILKGLPLTLRNCRISNVETGIATIGSNASVSAYFILIKNAGRGFSLFNNSNNVISNCEIILHEEDSDGIHTGGPNLNSIYTITNNIILFVGPSNQGAIAMVIGPTRKAQINNNLINKLGGIYFYDSVADTAFVLNNVFTRGVGISSAGNRIFANNNIFSKNYYGIDQLGSGFVSSNYNLFWENTYDFFRGPNYGDSDRVANPMFVKDTLPNPQLDFDYHLQAFSPGIDKGDPNILDVDGTRSDIGMFGGPYGETYTYQNLAPRAPVYLSAVVDSGEVTLTWNRNSEADTAYYNVYRDTTENFIISPAKLVGSPADTFFTETIPQQAESIYYKITAVDNASNESGPSEEVKINITAVDEYIPIVKDYYLYQNYPNPFNPTTKIGYKLKERSYVKLLVYDIKGELVKVIVNKQQNAGYYDVEFRGENLSSGIYLYRIEVIGKGNLPDGKAGIPRFSDMKKMILVK